MHCHMNDKNGVMWLRLRILKLRGLRTGVGKGRCFVREEEEIEVRIPLKVRHQDGGKNF